MSLLAESANHSNCCPPPYLYGKRRAAMLRYAHIPVKDKMLDSTGVTCVLARSPWRITHPEDWLRFKK